ncbi:MAG: universal stress protein [Myxococcota bacterium]
MGVLVGVDLPAGGHEWLVSRAGDYARRMSTQVDMVYFVGDDADPPAHVPALQAYLDTLPKGVRGTPRVAVQAPADGLVELSSDYDLLVLGSREPPALERLLKGAMAGKVLRRSHCPVLVPHSVGEQPEVMRLIVGVDVTSPDPDRVLSMGAEWAGRVGGKLDGLYVEVGRLPHIADRSVREAAEREWVALRQPQLDRLKALMHAAIPEAQRGEALLRRGEPEDVLVQLSADYDVVLVGNRNREGIARLVLGAVATAVARRSGCDVISLPTADT